MTCNYRITNKRDCYNIFRIRTNVIEVSCLLYGKQDTIRFEHYQSCTGVVFSPDSVLFCDLI